MRIIGLDVGTTATKAVVFDLDAHTSQMALREYPLLSPEPGWRVQDPEVIVGAALATVAELAGRDVLAISLSTAMHGLIGLDADLRPITPLITWADGRSTAQARSLRATGAAALLYEISGVPVHPMTPLTKLMWFATQDVRVAHWVGLKDYLIMRLTGKLVTELSSASATGLMDRRRLRWSPTAIEVAGIPSRTLPEIMATTDTLPLRPDAAFRAGLPAGIPVVLGAGDGPLGNVGTGALRPGIVGLSVGTSGAARMVVPQSTLDPQGRLFCYALTADQWVVGGAVSTGGSVVRWVGQLLGCGSDEEVLQRASTVPAGSQGLVMLPYLMAERAPLWDPELPGAYLGISSAHGPGHFARAAIEGVALQLATVVDALRRIEPVRQVRATGGALRSDLWREVLAGILDEQLYVSDGAQGTALGAAALGLFAIGASESLQEAVATLSPVEQATVTHPTASYDGLRRRVPELIAAYEPLATLF